MSQLADGVEEVQLAIGRELLDHAAYLLVDRTVGDGEMRYLAGRLVESLGDALRIAEGRGDRLSLTGEGEGEGGGGEASS
ncbi:hypothetical protein AB0D04_26070 [Streptomyces sp. NPDC048483]|uniref:hypothetical protein n=1 Tax=Streptomyces sp. NPDC048483 TaxID=3154927 RepID=UPI0034156F04